MPFLTSCIYRHRHVFPSLSPAVIWFTLTSIPASFGTKLWSVLLKISYCQLIFSLPLPLPNLPLINTQIISFGFFQWIHYWYPLKPTDDFPIPLETSEISPVMINLLPRSPTSFQTFLKPNSKWWRQNGRLASTKNTVVDVGYNRVLTADGHFVHCSCTGLQVFTLFYRIPFLFKKISASTTMCPLVVAWPVVSVAHLT
jgi:hypothetical protein